MELLHSLFERQARLHPHFKALKLNENIITYVELNNRSNQLAAQLISIGVKPGTLVNICLSRSVEMIISILAVLKTGAAYLPIDTKSPSERINFILSDAASNFVISSEELLKKKPQLSIVEHFIDINKIKKTTEQPDISINITDKSPAVVLYTSGSTGAPKAVLLSHEALVNRIKWDIENYKHRTDDVFLQHASYTFDFSILEIFLALSSGATLILARPEFHYESNYLIELIQKEKITKMGSVPSLLKSYIKNYGFEKCTSLKILFLGGEAVDYELQRTFFSKLNSRLINIYGPTETAISVLHWECDKTSKNKVIPIGYPVASMQIYLLDNNMNQVEHGQIGEIYIGGKGVALGYLNDDKLNFEKFLSNPFSDEDSVLYKTGDMGRQDSNGAYIFEGRIDFQVKIRGLRVEPNEIEFHLKNVEQIKDAIVLGSKVGNELKLAAFLVSNNNQALDVWKIKDYLSSRVPDYMIPPFFVQLPAFPLSANGKTDRNSLKIPKDLRLLTNFAYIPAQNETQQKLINIWEKTLNLKQIGINDPFDLLGGDSLALIETHRLTDIEFNTKLSIYDFAKSNTIKELALAITRTTKEEKEEETNIIKINQNTSNRALIFFQHIQSEGITTAQLLQKQLNNDIQCWSSIPYGLSSSNYPDSIESCANEYASTLLNEEKTTNFILGGYSMGGLIALEVADILKNNGREVELIYLIDTFQPEIIRHNYNKSVIRCKIKYYSKQLIHLPVSNKLPLIFHITKRTFKYLYFGRIKFITKMTNKLTSLFITNKSIFEITQKNINLILSMKFQLKTYNFNTIFFSAKAKSSIITFDKLLAIESSIKWKENIKENLMIYDLPADHETIINKKNLGEIAKVLNEKIKEFS
jgi:amino acid adenylation domain-containing protein